MNASSDDEKPERTVRTETTLAKGLMVLEALAKSNTGRGVSELSRELNLSKSNTFRLLQSLTALGYVRNADRKTYAATMKIWRLGLEVVDNLNLKSIAAPEMRRLSEATGEVVYLGVRDGLSVIYIDKIESRQPIRSWNPIGGGAPLHCVGTGKALLAADYDRLRPQMRDHLTRFTDRTITDLARLDKEMALAVERGFAVDTGEFRERVYSFGAVIRLPNGAPHAAIGVSLPDVNLPPGRDDAIGRLALEAAQAVSAALRRQ